MLGVRDYVISAWGQEHWLLFYPSKGLKQLNLKAPCGSIRLKALCYDSLHSVESVFAFQKWLQQVGDSSIDSCQSACNNRNSIH